MRPSRPSALAPVLLALAAPWSAAQQEGLEAPFDPAAALPTAWPAAPGEQAGALIVLNKGADTATLLDVASGATLATLPTGVGPHEVVITPDGRYAVCADYGNQQPGRSLTVIDLTSFEVAEPLDLGEAIRPHGLVFEPDGKHLWVSAETVRQAWRVAFPSGEVVARVPSEAAATHMVARAPDGRVVTANIGSGSASVLGPGEDGAWQLIAQVPTGEGAEGVCVLPDGGSYWVSNRGADTVSVIDPKQLRVVATLPCAGFPIRAEATPDGRLVLVSSATAGTLTLFDAHARERLDVLRMPFTPDGQGDALLGSMGASPIPIGIALHPNGKTAYVANAAVDRVAVVDLVRRKVVAALPTGRGPDGIAWFARVDG